jgi:hypothetical protein
LWNVFVSGFINYLVFIKCSGFVKYVCFWFHQFAWS